MIGPWKRARLEHARAEASQRALNKLTADWQLLQEQHADTARMLADAENIVRQLQDQAAARRDTTTELRALRTQVAIKDDLIRALEERLHTARREIEHWEREYGPVARARQLQERGHR